MGAPDPFQQSRRVRALLYTVAALFMVLVLRLFHLQVTTSATYERESEANRIERKRIKALRGLVLSRSGDVLARNAAFYSVSIHRCSRGTFAEAVETLELEAGWTVSRKYQRSGPWPAVLKRDVDFRTVAIVEESLKERWPLDIEIQMKRAYPYDVLAAHLLGYMGELRPEDVDRLRSKGYDRGDYFGKTGVEKVFEDRLRGADGMRYVEVDARRRERRQFPKQEQPAHPGQDLYLTLALHVQHAAEAALPDTLAGAVVAIDPRTGAVLAMASKPTFDPNVFVSFQHQEERKRILQHEGKPLLNRAVAGLYPPGSTLKMVAAVAALESGLTDTLSTFAACAGSLEVGETVFRCFKRDGHGEMNLIQALEASCNIYFQHLAQVMSIETWREYGSRFGLGQPTGLDLDPLEEVGLLPSRRYYRASEGWVQGHLMNLVIGQGAMLATPMQMVRYVAALANGGYLVTPHLTGKAVPRRRIAGVSSETLDIVRKAMIQVVYGDQGTGRLAQLDGATVAGKSGTAQVPNREKDDAWFVAYAPSSNPTIAVAVVVEGGGGGGSVAGPIARRVIAANLDIDFQSTPEFAPRGSGATLGNHRLEFP